MRQIIHLDMDAFYASVEMLDNPELKGKAVIVGGPAQRSVVSAASYEARKFGVHSAMPITRARVLCPHGNFMPVRMARYQEISRQIMAIFHRYTPLVEPISLDEAFLDVTGSIRLKGSAEDIAKKIKAAIHDETGLTASAGVASSKLLAKIASDLEKPDGLTIVKPGKEQQFLAPLPIKRLWGVGKSTLQLLALLGVSTIEDLSRLPKDILAAKFGKHGLHMHQAAQGIDERAVIPEREIKSIGNEATFATDLTDMKIIKRQLMAIATKVGGRLRAQQLTGKTISIKIKYNDFKQITRSETQNKPCNDSKKIFDTSTALLEKTEAGTRPIRLIGITISNLADQNNASQLELFGQQEKEKSRKSINMAMDNINQKYGSKTILPGVLLTEER